MPNRRFIALGFALVVAVVGSSCGDVTTVATTSAVMTSTAVVPTAVVPTSVAVATPQTTSSMSTVESTTTVVRRVPVFDFSSPAGLTGWSVVNDTVMGGVSTGQLAWDDGAMIFTGELSLDNNGGFASVRSPVIDPVATPAWSDRPGLALELRGDGRTWTVEVRMDGDNGGWISTIETSPRDDITRHIPWAEFEPVTRFLDPREPSVPLDPARIVSVALYLVDGVEAPFRLELRAVS